MPDTAHLLYCPFPSPEAARAAALQLLEARVIACANILGSGPSLYRWENTLTETEETYLLCKTSSAALAHAIDALNALHPYEYPAIVSIPAQTTAAFAMWLAAETTP